MGAEDGCAAEGPREAYARRLAERRVEAACRSRADARISWARFAAVGAAALIGWLAFGRGLLHPAWLAAPALGFLLLVVLHDRVIRARRRAERAAAYYEACLARLDDRWAGRGEPGERFLEQSHPYAADLDLFGPGSLFHLLCASRTRAGEETLASWLRGPASPEEIRARQAAVAELRPRVDLREELALLGEEIRSGVHPEALARWSAEPPVLTSRPARAAAFVLAALGVAGVLGWLAFGLPLWAALSAVTIEAGFALALRRRVRHVLGAVETPGRDLALLSSVMERLERERFTSPKLVALRNDLQAHGAPPSVQIARLARLIVLLDSRRNQLFAAPSYLLLWGTQIAFAVEAWRARVGPATGRWLAAVGELESLGSLAGYSFEHPGDPFPEIVEEGPLFEAEGIGHPLIPEARCVRNDLTLGGRTQVLVVSGSNMSGKSTLLRTVGVNAVLAMAGAPVRARRLRMSVLSVGASIRILDSLRAGTSRFYAEITRLRDLVDLARGPRRLLFLLDEILHGTNSHDRRIGAEAVVRGFAGDGAIGLVTTHDLALALIADALAPRAANVHFEDHLEDGRMTFDYRLRPGVVTKSNALALMRAVGLHV